MSSPHPIVQEGRNRLIRFVDQGLSFNGLIEYLQTLPSCLKDSDRVEDSARMQTSRFDERRIKLRSLVPGWERKFVYITTDEDKEKIQKSCAGLPNRDGFLFCMLDLDEKIFPWQIESGYSGRMIGANLVVRLWMTDQMVLEFSEWSERSYTPVEWEQLSRFGDFSDEDLQTVVIGPVVMHTSTACGTEVCFTDHDMYGQDVETSGGPWYEYEDFMPYTDCNCEISRLDCGDRIEIARDDLLKGCSKVKLLVGGSSNIGPLCIVEFKDAKDGSTPRICVIDGRDQTLPMTICPIKRPENIANGIWIDMLLTTDYLFENTNLLTKRKISRMSEEKSLLRLSAEFDAMLMEVREVQRTAPFLSIRTLETCVMWKDVCKDFKSLVDVPVEPSIMVAGCGRNVEILLHRLQQLSSNRTLSSLVPFPGDIYNHNKIFFHGNLEELIPSGAIGGWILLSGYGLERGRAHGYGLEREHEQGYWYENGGLETLQECAKYRKMDGVQHPIIQWNMDVRLEDPPIQKYEDGWLYVIYGMPSTHILKFLVEKVIPLCKTILSPFNKIVVQGAGRDSVPDV
ncbi:hypothetical protein BDK51DRAFT_29626 [Blyttiomyces helicus]|uniref:Uncharacterized protein n=1 Tax=Blyttiomyces helicus TaxID=388810 RepID=A0A4P9WTF0_9FUNG|nr:hypothetical protein BDK51DRAFT_29626 [Blyttiomyces helicus]|eukprot:RKO94630.1 hypothetical protein BDK51DRAFT_29626 [Blyttiomyces helicus]